MKAIYLTGLTIAAALLPTTLLAETQVFEGTAVIAAGSLNAPNPVEGCSKAKQDATAKAANAGFKNLVKWEHLSNDSDCSLSTQGARGTGFLYIFTAKGTFSK